jgi:hypothetical protein
MSFAATVVAACAASQPSDLVAAEASLGADAAAERPVQDLAAALAARGFVVQNGAFEFLDMSGCCATSCAGNNPSSPYAAFFVPPAPGQTAPNNNPRADGTSAAVHLRADEALVFVGNTPPEASYFGFTPYLMDRARPSGSRRSVFASLSETLNQGVITTAAPGPFEQRTAIIAAADATTVARARLALVASGIPNGAINVITFDPALGRFGLDEASDTFGILFRLALVKDPAKRDAYLANPGATLFRVTPSAAGVATPLPSPSPRPKATSPTEDALQPAVERLSNGITQRYLATSTSQAVSVDEGVPDPVACIQGLAVCAGDNRDTTYPGTPPRVLFADDDDFYVVFGVDHRVSGKTTYSNASVYAMEKLVGLVSVASDRYAGTAASYLPSDPEASKLYAWKFARHCDGDPFCTVVPKGACPTGIENGAYGNLTFRTYLEPSTNTAPSPSTLVRDRVLYFKKR